jgi:Zn-dependent M28 family amino/carboxypeptidase
MINIDMAASRNTPNLSVLLEGAPLSRGLIDGLAAVAATYTPLETQVSLQPFGSDHLPFLQAGLPAVLTIEGTDSAYEHEHTARDTPDRLDYVLHRAITRMDLAWLLEQTLPV